jgi:uncharacterized membrane protein
VFLFYKPGQKERRTISMNKQKTVFTVLVIALVVTALGAFPIQVAAQANSYDGSFDTIAQRHGYYRVLLAATGARAQADSGSYDSMAQRRGYYRAFMVATADANSPSLNEMAQRHGYYNALLAAQAGPSSASLDEVAQRHGYYQAFLVATTDAADAVARMDATGRP